MVTDAVLTTNDLNATLPFMALNGGGTINLLTDEIDIDATASFVDGPVLQSDPAMARMLDQRLPLNVGGTLGAPTILPDFGAMVKEELQEEVDKAVEEEKDELEQELDQEKEEAQDRIRDRLRRLTER
jgi:AsmA protein